MTGREDGQGAGRANLLAWVFAVPARALTLSAGECDRLLQQAQNCVLAGRLAAVLRQAGVLDDLPPRARYVLAMAEVIADNYRRQAHWEALSMRLVLQSIDLPLVLLKGGAYVMADLEAGHGRVLSDIDILVPREELGRVESAFLRNGWLGMKSDDYDDHYYREWSHELPPMQHLRRGTVVDIHHSILPPTARYTVEGAPLLPLAQEIPEYPGMMTLHPVDIVLHNIVHLFADGAMENGLRDLVDLQSLLRQLAHQPGFWRRLLMRAEEFGLSRPLFYALVSVERILEYPVPGEVMAELRSAQSFGVDIVAGIMERALRPLHRSAEGPDVAAARFAVFVRSHYLRMPMSMLIPHLTRKAFRRWKQDEAAA